LRTLRLPLIASSISMNVSSSDSGVSGFLRILVCR
jgi:hypothetical protein